MNQCLCLALLCALSFTRTHAQTVSVKELANHPQVQRALAHLKATEDQTINDQIKACEIPAPTFQETQRGLYLKQRFTELGLQNVRVDSIGNVIGERPGVGAGTGSGPVLILAAHLDTVFPAGTDVKVKRNGATLSAPGIGDDSRGLGVILGVLRGLNEARLATQGTLIFVANVGEEGLGDLRGVRHLFNGEFKGRATHFISVDGTGLGITNVAVGVERYRVTYRGPGGHSYGAFGLPSPIHALGRAMEKIARWQTPAAPKTTFNIGKLEGGTSVNSIAHTAWMEVDMRSESARELQKLDAEFQRVVQTALDEENTRAKAGKRLTMEVKSVSRRPAGVTAKDAPIVQIALAADAALGIPSDLGSGSTDANIPISLGLSAITIDGGGVGRDAHSLDESFDTTNSHLGTQRALLIVLGIVGVKKVMRALLQRVTEARVTIGGQVTGEIGAGLVILLGVGAADTAAEVETLAQKIANLRIFADGDGKFNLSALDVGAQILVVSQFTLFADTRRGRRPSFTNAARPALAIPLYEQFVARLRELGFVVATGEFGAEMLVELHNSGPVTIWLDTNEWK